MIKHGEDDHLDDDRPKEECGVLGLFAPDRPVANLAFFGLFALQHRGQESAGIAVSDGSRVRMHRGMGLVNQVFHPDDLAMLKGHMAVGHTRYSTTGASVLRNAGPIYCQSQIGEIAVAHNGNLINTDELREEMKAANIHLDTTSDSEMIARILVSELHRGPEEAVREVMRRVKGAYSVTVLTPKMVIGFRDPHGVRPLTAGRILPVELPTGEKYAGGYMIASETCAFGPVGGEPTHELAPGEMVIIDAQGMRFEQGIESPRKSMCLFEFIYFARPDSRMYGTSLYSARERMGMELAREHPVEADIVVPVPDSGIPAALGYSAVSGIPFREGMMKSRYIHRTFIQPDQSLRELGVRMKLTALEDHLRGKRVILVDDSIVRGTTTKQIIKLIRDAGATEVHVRITAPPIKFPCFYGIDMATRSELVAARLSVEELCQEVGATSLGYLSIEGASAAVGNMKDSFCFACFTGDYPIPIPPELQKLAFENPPSVGQMGTFHGSQPPLIVGTGNQDEA
ncbi:MAG: amidophosphoribosyltransferase [Fimbriimonas sp.]